MNWSLAKRVFFCCSKLVLVVVVTAGILLSSPARLVRADSYGDIVITEVMYDSLGTPTDVEWVELYNPGDTAVDLSNWVLTDDDTYPATNEGECAIPASTSIPAKGFLVFSKVNTGISGAVQCTGTANYTFGNSGDNIALFNDVGQLIFGSLALQYPDIAATNAGESIGLTNPLAGWSSVNADWLEETSTSDENLAEFAFDTAGEINDSWAGNITTPNANIIANGTVITGGEWEQGERLGASDNATYYVSWTTTHILVGITGGNTGNNGDKYNVLIDIDPTDSGSSNSGTTSEYCGATFPVDAKPDYALQLSRDGSGTQIVTRSQATADGSGWEAWTPTDSGGNMNNMSSPNGNVEFYIDRDDDLSLGDSAEIALYLYTCTLGNRVWSSWPPENPIDVSNVVNLTTRTQFEGTGSNRSPKYDAIHRGVQTLSANSVGNLPYFDDYANLNVITGGGASCEVTITVLANRVVSQFHGGARRSYTISPSNCTGLVTDVTLKYEDGVAVDTVDELRGLLESDLRLFRHSGGSAWTDMGADVLDMVANKVTVLGISSFSAWSFGTGTQAPTAVSLTTFTVNPTTPIILILFTLFVIATGWLWQRRRA